MGDDLVVLRDLPRMTRTQLIDSWARVVGKPMVRAASRKFIIHAIAWHLQAKRHGGLPPSLQRKLERLGASIERSEPNQFRSSPASRLRPGTSLERNWQGQRHLVMVTADGFVFAGKTYRSLSQIAREITGTRWNGPAFFGLRGSTTHKTKSNGDGA